MKKIIITADDYGMSHEVNEAIKECISAGVVTSTNVLLNMEAAQAAAKLRINFPHISVGIHWNVTTGKPVSDIDIVNSLVNDSGNFWPVNVFRERGNKRLINESELEKELIAQYDIFTGLCGQPDYWNTHEDSVLCYRAYKVFSKVARDKRIVCTRNFQRVYIDKDTISFKRRIREFIISRIADLWFGCLVRRDFQMPDGKLFPFNFESQLNAEKLIESLKKNNKKIIEIMIHPSKDANNPLYGNMSEQRVKEYEFFSQSKLRHVLTSSEMIICNFQSVT